jgi:hypothetical protein
MASNDSSAEVTRLLDAWRHAGEREVEIVQILDRYGGDLNCILQFVIISLELFTLAYMIWDFNT